ncbi:MAG: hypothetical protein HFJ39_06955, partial [Bifidobacterium pseudolongum]|nr:hypothetical protein [Bifidobacterium pseudolongum]
MFELGLRIGERLVGRGLRIGGLVTLRECGIDRLACVGLLRLRIGERLVGGVLRGLRFGELVLRVLEGGLRVGDGLFKVGRRSVLLGLVESGFGVGERLLGRIDGLDVAFVLRLRVGRFLLGGVKRGVCRIERLLVLLSLGLGGCEAANILSNANTSRNLFEIILKAFVANAAFINTNVI